VRCSKVRQSSALIGRFAKLVPVCGRYRIRPEEPYLRDHFSANGDVSLAQRYNIVLTQRHHPCGAEASATRQREAHTGNRRRHFGRRAMGRSDYEGD
jgi:hypothetical protein